MQAKDAKAFFEKVERDRHLQNQLTQLDVTIVEIAKQAGYSFTLQELQAHLKDNVRLVDIHTETTAFTITCFAQGGPMQAKDAKAFFEKVEHDRNLQDQLTQLDVTIVEIAKRAGYSFTLQELQAYSEGQLPVGGRPDREAMLLRSRSSADEEARALGSAAEPAQQELADGRLVEGTASPRRGRSDPHPPRRLHSRRVPSRSPRDRRSGRGLRRP